MRGNILRQLRQFKPAIADFTKAIELDGKLIMADVITRPHPELAALLPA